MKFDIKPIRHYTHHLGHVATLPLEIKKSIFADIFETQCIYDCASVVLPLLTGYQEGTWTVETPAQSTRMCFLIRRILADVTVNVVTDLYYIEVTGRTCFIEKNALVGS